MNKKMSLREFAAKIGVSPGTVSKALQTGTKYRISPDKICYIREQMKRLGFDNSNLKDEQITRQPRIGLICGSMLEYLGSHFYNGVHDVCNKNGITLIFESCDHDVEKEKLAFRHMCSENIDSLIYWPAAKPIRKFELKSLKKVEKTILENIPCVVIGDDSPINNAYKIIYPAEDAGRNAALRQLQKGCRKFAIMQFKMVWQDDHKAENAYRQTLLENGVSAKNIKVMTLDANEPPERFECLKTVQGIWLNHLFLLHAYMPYIKEYTDLKQLHVDGLGYHEFFRFIRIICSPLYKNMNVPDSFGDAYASSGVLFYHTYELGALAAHKAMELAGKPKEQWHGTTCCKWYTEEELKIKEHEKR